MSDPSTVDRLRDRAAGAVMGAFIGDALALGPHWYYNLDELHAAYGEWIAGYTDPQRDEGTFERGWLVSGDIGHVDVGGRVFVTGRAKDVIIRGAHNIDQIGRAHV